MNRDRLFGDIEVEMFIAKWSRENVVCRIERTDTTLQLIWQEHATTVLNFSIPPFDIRESDFADLATFLAKPRIFDGGRSMERRFLEKLNTFAAIQEITKLTLKADGTVTFALR